MLSSVAEGRVVAVVATAQAEARPQPTRSMARTAVMATTA
ncbi:Uncharacterised protein [Collinsella intestinalis]|nr:Uncharacterised protein [Collinsella intestinalis]